ncbi:MAG: heavy metal translocating P-type ATPase metal-binding domain-containing protein, partial [Halioglobus sp.]|nr:heavy metal translocating P-type ATPase metal-binding domain-containing protein [Halioglobus sp.]
MNAITEGRFASQAAQCFHCGEPVPDGCDISIVIDGKSRPMCCPGCRAVASLISGSGLSNFYRRRTAFNERPVSLDDVPENAGPRAAFPIYDDPELAATFSTRDDQDLVHARLLIGGISSA